jgi:hypothetical protein
MKTMKPLNGTKRVSRLIESKSMARRALPLLFVALVLAPVVVTTTLMVVSGTAEAAPRFTIVRYDEETGECLVSGVGWVEC